MKKTAIVDELYRIAKDNDITILFASEVGSRSYGFASPDSDFDVKFIFIRPEKEYLKIKRDFKDVIDVRTNISRIDVDFNGWDITKFLTLMYDGNYSTFEWLNSPHIYIEDAKFIKVVKEFKKYFIPYRAILAYWNHAKGMQHEMRYEESIPIKKYLHAVDAILNATQCSISRVSPALTLSTKLYLIKDDKIINIVIFLMRLRQKGITDTERILELDTYINSSISHISVLLQKWEGKRDSLMKYDTMDCIFYQLVKEVY